MSCAPEYGIVQASCCEDCMTGRYLRIGLFLFVLFSGFVLLSRTVYKAGARVQRVDVVIYGKDTCPYCRKAKALLQEYDVRYTYHDLSIHPEKGREAFAHLSAGEPATIPQVFVESEHVGGYSDLQSLVQTGAIWAKIS